MKSFFRELSYCEHEIFEEGYFDLKSLEPYSDDTKKTLSELIEFVESGKFIKAKSGKFIASHFRMSVGEMTETWYKTFRKKKEENTIRGQISETSRVLHRLFGEKFSEDLILNEPARIQSILNCFGIGNVAFEDLFIDEISECIKRPSDNETFEVSDLSAEIAFLIKYRRGAIKREMSQLDQVKLSYVKEVLKKPLVVDYKVNEEKVKLLNEICQNVEVSEAVEFDIELPAGRGVQFIGDVVVPTVLVEILSGFRDEEGQLLEKNEYPEEAKKVLAVLAKHSVAMIRKDFEDLNKTAVREMYKMVIAEHENLQQHLSKYQEILYDSTFSKDTRHTALSYISDAED